jgi:FixJ family two-component response regulator
VIVTTSFGNTFTYIDVIRAGAKDFISKPFNANELEGKLKRLVKEQNIIKQITKNERKRVSH